MTTLGRISRRSFVTGLGSLALGHADSAWTAEGGAPFLVIGDWDTGSTGQKRLARQMGRVAEAVGARFVISTGDNFYPRGVESEDDKQWKWSYEDVYQAPSLRVPWYAVLGNHDHRGNVAAQINYSKQSPRWRMPAPYYRHTEVLGEGATADFFFIDTDPIRRQYQRWAGRLVANRQIAWLKQELADSTARWKIVVGHHPVFSGEAGKSTPALRKWLRPLLEKYRVQAYLNGHSHTLEHIAVGGVHHLTSGAGASPRRSKATPNTRFLMQGQHGFLVVRLAPRFMDVDFRNAAGKSLYQTRI